MTAYAIHAARTRCRLAASMQYASPATTTTSLRLITRLAIPVGCLGCIGPAVCSWWACAWFPGACVLYDDASLVFRSAGPYVRRQCAAQTCGDCLRPPSMCAFAEMTPECTARIVLKPGIAPGWPLGLNEIRFIDHGGNALAIGDLIAVLSSQRDPNTTNYKADNCIDGDTGPGASKTAACQVADDDKNPQLNVTFMCDTGKALDTVSRVEVYNQVACCQDRITHYQLQLINSDGSVAQTFPFDTRQDEYTFPGGAPCTTSSRCTSVSCRTPPLFLKSTGAACGGDLERISGEGGTRACA